MLGGKKMAIQFFDPTGSQEQTQQVTMAPRFQQLQGLRVNILDNGKQNSAQLLSMVAKLLQQQEGVTVGKMSKKSMPSTPASEEELREAVVDADIVLTGTGD